jgi:cell division septation protein DedD
MVEERRQHARLVPASPMFVSLDKSRSGLLLDVCEGGVAIASLVARNMDDVLSLAFELPEGRGQVQAMAEVAWTRDSGHLTGVRFLNVDELSRRMLCGWIGATAPAAQFADENPATTLAEQLALIAEEDFSSPAIEEHAADICVSAGSTTNAGDTENIDTTESTEITENAEHDYDGRNYADTDDVGIDAAIDAGIDTPEHAAPVANELTAEASATEERPAIHDAIAGGMWEIQDELFSPKTPETPTAPHALVEPVTPEMPLELDAPHEVDAPVENVSTNDDSIPDATISDASTHAAAFQDEPVFVTRSSNAPVDTASRESVEENAWLTALNAPSQPMTEAGPPEPQVLTELGLNGGSAKSRHTIELILAVVVLSWALVFLGYQMGSTGVSRQSTNEVATTAGATSAAAAKEPVSEPASRGLVPSVQASPAPKREAPSALTLADSGVVLQVGAMKQEDNADVLAQELQKKNLPAFVFRHGHDQLYRVAVGPFSNDDATAKAKAKLEKQGLKAIVRPWLPE